VVQGPKQRRRPLRSRPLEPTEAEVRLTQRIVEQPGLHRLAAALLSSTSWRLGSAKVGRVIKLGRNPFVVRATDTRTTKDDHEGRKACRIGPTTNRCFSLPCQVLHSRCSYDGNVNTIQISTDCRDWHPCRLPTSAISAGTSVVPRSEERPGALACRRMLVSRRASCHD